MKHRLVLAFCLPSLCAASSALAQEEDAVVVSATRGPRPSLEIPASVDRLYAEEIREGRPQVDLSESLGRVPGIVVQNRQNYAQDLQISSRGFGARSTFGVRGIRLIADGIPATMPDGQGQAATFALGSAERIEVLRGPFSSLYGNASGGVIVIETEDAPERPFAQTSLSFGTYDTWRGALKAGGRRGPAGLLAELSRFETEGYRAHSAARRDHLNAKLKYALSPDTALTVVGNSLRQPETQDPLGLTRAQVEQDPRQASAVAFTFNTRKTVDQDQVGTSVTHRLGGGASLQATVYGGTRFVEQYLAIPLVVQQGARHSGGVVNLDRDFGGGALRYSSGPGVARFSAGAEYERMDERRRGFLNNNGVAGALKRDEDDTVSSADLYAQGEWQFDERWSAHAGVRTSRVRFRSEDFFITEFNPDDSGARAYRATTPLAGIVYRLRKNVSVYGNLGRGFETPTFAELAYRSTGPDGGGLNFALEASRSRHGELGVKAVFPGLGRASAALFDVATRDEIVVDENAGGRTTFKNAGRTERRGLELGAETQLAGPWQAQLAYTALRAVFEDGFATPGGAVPAGSLLPGVPRTQLYGAVSYRAASFFARLEALRKGRVAVNDRNSEFAEAFTVANLVFGLAQTGERWTLSEFVRIDNFTDRNYVGSVIVNDGNGRYYEPSPRRTMMLGVQANLRF